MQAGRQHAQSYRIVSQRGSRAALRPPSPAALRQIALQTWPIPTEKVAKLHRLTTRPQQVGHAQIKGLIGKIPDSGTSDGDICLEKPENLETPLASQT